VSEVRSAVGGGALIGAEERSVTTELAFGAQEYDFKLVASALDPLERCFATHGSTAPVALMNGLAAVGTGLACVARWTLGREFGRDGHGPWLAAQGTRGDVSGVPAPE
jgi:hypothetical protein